MSCRNALRYLCRAHGAADRRFASDARTLTTSGQASASALPQEAHDDQAPPQNVKDGKVSQSDLDPIAGVYCNRVFNSNQEATTLRMETSSVKIVGRPPESAPVPLYAEHLPCAGAAP